MPTVRIPRIYHAAAMSVGGAVTLTGDAASHVARVLRLGEGDELILFSGDGREHTGRITALRRGAIDVAIGDTYVPCTESPLHIILLQALCRGPRMDTVIQKATELGVLQVQPLITQRVVVKLTRDRATRRAAHWQGVARSACEQSGRATVPGIGVPLSLEQAIQRLPSDARTRILLDSAGGETLAQVLAPGGACALLVGPEGGLTETERRCAIDAGFRGVRLGPRILRTETAPIAALSIVQYLRGDLARISHED